MTYTLLQYGDDPIKHHFIDTENRPAFTISVVAQDPNTVLRLARETPWSSQHPSIMGPDNSYFYLGPESSKGYVIYGNNASNNIPMNQFLRLGKQKQGLSRYFKTLSGKECKWRVGSHRMECLDGRTVLATWEVSTPDNEFYARLHIKQNGLPYITEIVTALVVNRIALAESWECPSD